MKVENGLIILLDMLLFALCSELNDISSDYGGLGRGEIITNEDEEELSLDGKTILLIPAFKYLLNMEPV